MNRIDLQLRAQRWSRIPNSRSFWDAMARGLSWHATPRPRSSSSALTSSASRPLDVGSGTYAEFAAAPVAHIGFKPLLVGAMHGLAGSAALILLVLTQINLAVVGLLYLMVFGAGSIVGMLLTSGLIGLPFALSARKLTGVHYRLQAAVGASSIAFGCWYVYQTGITNGLLQSLL